MNLKLFPYLFGVAIAIAYDYDPNIKLVRDTYTSSKDGLVEFIDINNELSDYVEYSMEVLITGLQFAEGPKWIDLPFELDIDIAGQNEVIDGYLLFTEIQSNKIYKYYENTNGEQSLNVMAEYDNCGPAGIGWNKKVNINEIWIACLLGAKVLKVDLNTFEIIQVFSKPNDIDPYPLYADDVDVDGNGNVYITDYPPMYVSGIDDTAHRGGLYVIKNGSDRIDLVEYINYGLNGIAINDDETLMVVSNSIELPLANWDFTIFDNRNDSNIFFRGYDMRNNDVVTAEDGFMYLNTSNPQFANNFNYNGKYHYFLDSSGFDIFDNFWQCVYLSDENGVVYGQISIVNNKNDANSPNYVGTISIKDQTLAVNNVEVTSDHKYMYATGGNWVSLNTGSLSRFTLKNKKESKQEL